MTHIRICSHPIRWFCSYRIQALGNQEVAYSCAAPGVSGCSNAGSGGTEGMKRFRAVSLHMRGSKRAQNCCNGPSWTYMTRVPSVPQRSLAIMALYSMSWLTKVPRKTLRAPGAPTCAKPPQGIGYAVILCFPVSLSANSWNRLLSYPNII